ncbi:RCS-specific HTH-type transcriptional activator RclR [Pseudoalteromonas sp. CIP111854]|uniref:RCS-specific HTH-type transcriptional activator RclR n=2 Tax=Pseudoalteromonas holothuriae TaxID=2963714 RepID=A0A9W4VM09_9GAMM|nr:RCS-specific HTH-type transcriptional activator RclR [Pseudoalteromonas sp. CIP111854]
MIFIINGIFVCTKLSILRENKPCERAYKTMSKSPNIYLNDPDPLSVLLRRLDLKAEVYVNADFCGTWAVDTGGSKRIPFHLVGSGYAWLHFDGQAPLQLTSHDLVIFPSDAHHVISNSKTKPALEQVNAPMSNEGDVTNMVCGFFEFRNPVLFPVLASLPQVVVIKADTERSGKRIALLIKQVLNELKHEHPGFYTVIDQMAFLIFIEVLRQQMQMGGLDKGLLGALFNSKLGKVLNAIHQQPELPWTLERLAEEAFMSRSAFADMFSKTVGLTPMKYLTQWRMTQARHLLKTTQLSVAQIAHQSGYESEAAFRKAYRNTLGEPPGAARAHSL